MTVKASTMMKTKSCMKSVMNLILLSAFTLLFSCSDNESKRIQADNKKTEKLLRDSEEAARKARDEHYKKKATINYDDLIEKWGLKEISKDLGKEYEQTEEVKELIARLQNEDARSRYKTYIEIDKLNYKGLLALLLKDLEAAPDRDKAAIMFAVKSAKSLNKDAIFLMIIEELKKEKPATKMIAMLCSYFRNPKFQEYSDKFTELYEVGAENASVNERYLYQTAAECGNLDNLKRLVQFEGAPKHQLVLPLDKMKTVESYQFMATLIDSENTFLRDHMRNFIKSSTSSNSMNGIIKAYPTLTDSQKAFIDEVMKKNYPDKAVKDKEGNWTVK